MTLYDHLKSSVMALFNRTHVTFSLVSLVRTEILCTVSKTSHILVKNCEFLYPHFFDVYCERKPMKSSARHLTSENRNDSGIECEHV